MAPARIDAAAAPEGEECLTADQREARAKTAAVIVAAGRGSRAGGPEPKQWCDLGGETVLARAARAFRGCARLVIVLHPDDMARGLRAFSGQAVLVAGGESRSESVRNALETLENSGIDRVLIHDAARPLVPQAVIDAVLSALDDHPAAAPGLAMPDTLWRADAEGHVAGFVPRDDLWRAQTPQGFRLQAILEAHRAQPEGASDDVTLARAAGLAVKITPGDERNFKITWPGDHARAAEILAREGQAQPLSEPPSEARTDSMSLPSPILPDIRLGNGYDVHAFTGGDHVILCGVKIPHDKALLGHSDADVGMHALTDALYGAMAEGDIGRHFPPSDPQWKGAASEIFLAHAAGLARSRGFAIGNVDVTLVCEHPKIGPHATAMMAELARILEVDPGRVSVKATTSERLGFTGRGEGIAALATATLIAATPIAAPPATAE